MDTKLTHYERAMTVAQPYMVESQAAIQRAVAQGTPVNSFIEYLKEERERVLQVTNQGELINIVTGMSGRIISRLHFLTMEQLRRQKSKFAFPELAKDPVFGKAICASCMSNDLAITNVVGHMHYHMAMHRITGRKVFDVSSALAEKLRHTELRGLTADDLKLPYPNIYIMVPPEADLQIYNLDSDWHRVVGIYLTEDVDGQGRRCWRFMVCGEPKPQKVVAGLVDDNDALIYFHVSLPAGVPLDTTVALAHEETLNDLKEAKSLHVSGFEHMLDKWKDIFHWAMNVVLYQAMDGADREEAIANEAAKKLLEQLKQAPKGSKQRERLNEKLGKTHQMHRIFLGRHVGRPGGWQLTVKVLVTGHWRNQAHGPGRLLRKLIWIEPHWRGPDALEGAAAEVPPVAPQTGGSEHEPRDGTSAASAVGAPDAKTGEGDRRADGSSDRGGGGAEQDRGGSAAERT